MSESNGVLTGRPVPHAGNQPGSKWLSTGQVAGLLGMAARTVTDLADANELKCWRLPTARTPAKKGQNPCRRYDPADVVAFCLARGVPVPEPLRLLCDRPARVTVLVVSPAADVSWDLPARGEAVVAGDEFEAGRAADRIWPAVVVIDAALGRSRALALAQAMRRCAWAAACGWVLVDAEDHAGDAAAGFDVVVPRPLAPGAVAGAVRRLAGA